MIPELIPPLSALELHDQIVQLEAERELAVLEGLDSVSAYMEDLDAELEHRRALYVATVLTDIATLRGELFGVQVG
jgi:hypothetical protein